MSLASVAARGRLKAEATMTLTLTPYVPGAVTKDADNFDVQAYAAQSTHKGKVQATSQEGDTTARQIRLGGAERPVLVAGLHIPIDAPIPTAGTQRGKGWEYVVSAVGAADDPELLGRRYLVVNVPAKSFATSRRLDVVEV